MNHKNKMKLLLHQFCIAWDEEAHLNHGLDVRDFDERMRQSAWLPQMRALPEIERLAVLQSALISDPPMQQQGIANWFRKGTPHPVQAFLMGRNCLDTQEALETLFRGAVAETANGYWLRYAIKPLGALRTIDLIYQCTQGRERLSILLYDFERDLLGAVAPDDREMIKQYYLKRKEEARQHDLILRGDNRAEEMRKVEARLEAGLRSTASQATAEH